MRVLAWNIRHGGGARIAALADAIVSHAPDLVLLTEYRAVPGLRLRERLHGAGYAHAIEPRLAPRQNGVAILSRWPMDAVTALRPRGVPRNRWVEATVPGLGASFAAFYGPLEDVPYDRWWTAVHATIARRVGRTFLIAGDFNTGLSVVDAPRDPFYCANHFQAVLDLGMSDLWRQHNPSAREYSWFSIRGEKAVNGFRLDHALASPSLASRLFRAYYSHDERVAGLSDHSALVIDFNPMAQSAAGVN